MFNSYIIFSLLVLCTYLLSSNFYKNNKENITYLIIKYEDFKNDLNKFNNISIIMLVDDQNLSNYEIAVKTAHCYSILHGYNFIILNILLYKDLLIKCTQKDFMFRRHCILANYLEDYKINTNYVLFIDADMGIVNPTFKLTDFTPSGNEEFLFEERIFNFEISAGSYFFRNTKYSRNILLNWANFENNIPSSFTGSDNVALHPYLLKYIPQRYLNGTKICEKIWNNSKSFIDTHIYVACIRHFMNNYCHETNNENEDEYSLDNGRIKIIKKLSKRKWVRDVWLAESEWSMNDFMFHGLKKSSISASTFGSWEQILFVDNYNISNCNIKSFHENWIYNKKFMRNAEHIKQKIEKRINLLNMEHKKIIKNLSLGKYTDY
uniref:Nucleotid_trans domain-containing protein n=1 Tax=Parastrongyloides trichosuri TaxID=131310 RepID=A0A0N4Z3A1_PARTI